MRRPFLVKCLGFLFKPRKCTCLRRCIKSVCSEENIASCQACCQKCLSVVCTEKCQEKCVSCSNKIRNKCRSGKKRLNLDPCKKHISALCTKCLKKCPACERCLQRKSTRRCITCLTKFLACLQTITHGWARKVAFACILMSIMGYFVFASGFGMHLKKVPISKSATLRTLFLPYWSAIILGPITYLLLILHMALSYRFKKARIILESLCSVIYIVYTMSLSTPFVLAALFIYKASGFTKFEEFAKSLVPLPSIQKILGLDNAFVNALIGIVKTLYNLMEKAINFIVD